jgi:hypothetical protein
MEFVSRKHASATARQHADACICMAPKDPAAGVNAKGGKKGKKYARSLRVDLLTCFIKSPIYISNFKENSRGHISLGYCEHPKRTVRETRLVQSYWVVQYYLS